MGGFLQVSGLKYTIDTTVKSSAKGDDKSMFVSVDGAYRVKNVKVLKNGKYVDIDPKATYTVASHNYMLKDSGDGINMFADNKLLQDSVMLDNQVLINYIKDSLGGIVPATYAAPQGRITVIATPYTDVLDGNWAVEAVNYVTDKNFMKGLSETTFGPNGALTRGMLVTVLYRMAGSPEVTGKVSEKFTDCTDGSWYADAVLWASANKIVDGYEDGTYKPTKAISRQEMAKVHYGYGQDRRQDRRWHTPRSSPTPTLTRSANGRSNPSPTAPQPVIWQAPTEPSTRRALRPAQWEQRCS